MQIIRRQEKLSFPTLLATSDVAGVYNIVYRYLFDRRRDLGLPTSFLIDHGRHDRQGLPGTGDCGAAAGGCEIGPRHIRADRMRKALPFAGTLFQSTFQRNDFTYGVSFFQHGYLDQAEASFKQVIAAKPDNPEAYYNLGTLYLRRNAFPDARQYLEQAVKLRPDYPEAWNNLGMIAAQRKSARMRRFATSSSHCNSGPTYTIALLNLGNLYRRQGNFAEAEKFLNRAHEIEPDDPEVNYNLGMLYARQDQAQTRPAVSGKGRELASRLSRRAQQSGRALRA